MRIGALAERSGLSAPAIRYYESIDLLPEPERTPSGYRSYGNDALDRLRFIREAQAVGLTLAEVQTLLSMKDAGARTCEHTVAFLRGHIAAIDDGITRLRAVRAEMVALVERADGLDPAECVDPHRCQVIGAS